MKIKRSSTLFKYIASYMFLLILFSIAIFVSFEYQLKDEFVHKNNEKYLYNIQSVQKVAASRLMELQRIGESILSDLTILTVGKENNYGNKYLAGKAITEERNKNLLIEDILYFNLKNDYNVSNRYPVSHSGERYILQSEKEEVDLPLEELVGIPYMKMVSLKGTEKRFLCYAPRNQSESYQVLIMINQSELLQYFEGMQEFNAWGIMELETGDMILGDNTSILDGIEIPIKTSAEYYNLKDQFLYVSEPVFESFALVGIKSKAELVHAERQMFYRTYCILLGFAMIGLIFICFALRITYLPLYRLTKKVVKDERLHTNYLEQIDQIFQRNADESARLQKKVEDYRISMQCSILGSTLLNENAELTDVDQEKIDRCFRHGEEHAFYVIQFMSKELDSIDKIIKYMEHALMQETVCILLDKKNDGWIILVDYLGSAMEKDEIFLLLLEEMSEEYLCNIAVSNRADTPLEIAALYENVIMISEQKEYVSSHSVLRFCDLQEEMKDARKYPYESIEEMGKGLEQRDVETIKMQLNRILQALDKKGLPVFLLNAF